MRKRQLILQIMAYVLYGLVVLIIYVYATFPYHLLQQLLAEELAQQGIQLAIARLHPTLLPGLQAQDVRLRFERFDNEAAALRLNTLRIWPQWLSLLSWQPQVGFEATLYRGHLQGHVHATVVNGAPGWDMQAILHDLDVTEHPLLQHGEQTLVRGQLSADAALMLGRDYTPQGGMVQVRLQPLVVVGQALQVPLPHDIVCNTVQGEMTMEARQVSNVSLTCTGDDLAIEASGMVTWQPVLSASQFNMRWQIRSETAYKQELDLLSTVVRQRSKRRGEVSFRTYGTLQKPRIGT